MSIAELTKPNGLVEFVEFLRLDAGRRLSDAKRAEMGQYFTPSRVARFMSSLSEPPVDHVRLLDPGAGVGSLTAAWVAEMAGRSRRPRFVRVTAFELDKRLVEYLRETLDACNGVCRQAGIDFSAEVLEDDFVETAVEMIVERPMLDSTRREFDCAILNPPYRKISSDSPTRRVLRSAAIETTNLYAAFLWLTFRLLAPKGEMIAITPRSFCNGPYFRPFRDAFLKDMSLRRVHVFTSRSTAFADDDVLQENVVFRATKQLGVSEATLISESDDPDCDDMLVREVEPGKLVRPDDADKVIHIVPNALGDTFSDGMASFSATLDDLGICVSTGRVVDFRAKAHLAMEPTANCAPLIYPTHLENGWVRWPKPGKKPNYLIVGPETEELLVPSGSYVLVKRFSAKEEPRRVMAAICGPQHVDAPTFAFENHLNYFHRRGQGLPPDLGKGLAAYLNSTLVDNCFRQFSGHTQVNAADLRRFKYPDALLLQKLGRRIGDSFPSQAELDQIVSEELGVMTNGNIDALKVQQRIEEAKQVLASLGLPKAQQNERSALTLLALLDLKPNAPWRKASAKFWGITPMMEFFAAHYGKKYAPNSRETVRRQTVHQFLEAAIIVANPDEPQRPINSGKTVYQIEPFALKLLQSFGRRTWDRKLRAWLTSVETLRKRYAKERDLQRIPLNLASGQRIDLSPGGQNVLVERIVHEFCPRFTPGGKPIYVGDADKKWAYFDESALTALGVAIDPHGKMPDVVVHHRDKNWLVLVEAVTTHGPVDSKRRDELARLFQGCTAGLVFVTAFLNRQAMVRYLNDISWETEVWVADAPSHLIHFNGERFLGPH